MKNQKRYLIIACVLLILSLSLNLYFIFPDKQKGNKEMTDFSFLDPSISGMNVDDFLDAKEEYISSYTPLKKDIEKILSKTDGYFG